MENPIKMDDLGGTIIFGNTHILSTSYYCSATVLLVHFPMPFLWIHLCLRLQPILLNARSKTCLPATRKKIDLSTDLHNTSSYLRVQWKFEENFVVFRLVNHINNHMPQHILSSAVGKFFCCDSESKNLHAQNSEAESRSAWSDPRWHVWTMNQKSPANKNSQRRMSGVKNTKIRRALLVRNISNA